jgi:cytochrome c-type biogenesis protein CcmE
VNLRFFSLIIIAVAVCLFMVFQATTESKATVLLPTQLLTGNTQGADLKRIRVGGKVSSDPIQYDVSPSFLLKFSIHNPGKIEELKPEELRTIPVIYQGIKPDMFTAGRDVIIDGEYKDGTLQANKLLTQCPSKYEPPSAEKMAQDYK